MIFWWNKKNFMKFMKSIFHYSCKETWIDFGLGSLYDHFCDRSWEVIVFFFRTRASTVIPAKWCKTFEACTRTISEFDKNLSICYNIVIRRYDNPENFSSLSCTDLEKSFFKKLASSDWKLWKWRFKVNLHDLRTSYFRKY